MLPTETIPWIVTTRNIILEKVILDCFHQNKHFTGSLPPRIILDFNHHFTLFWVVTWNDVGVEERHDEDDAQASGQHDVQHAQNQPRNKQTSQLKIYMNFIISSTNMQS